MAGIGDPRGFLEWSQGGLPGGRGIRLEREVRAVQRQERVPAEA